MQLTRDNYYTPEADREFLSCSQYEEFLEDVYKRQLQYRFQNNAFRATVDVFQN